MSDATVAHRKETHVHSANSRTLLMLTVIVGGILFSVLNLSSGGSVGDKQQFNAAACAPNAIQISIDYMPLSDPYMPQVIANFNRAYASGIDPVTQQSLSEGQQAICITGKEGASGQIMDGIINALVDPNKKNVERPTIFQPAARHWLTLANYRAHRQLFDSQDIYPVAMSPVVIAIWESRLNALRKKVGYDNIGWQELVDVLHSPNGWQDYGIPNGRRAVYYGHTDPNISSTGLSTLIAEFYASASRHGFSDTSLTTDLVNRPEVQAGVSDIEKLIRHYAPTTTEFKFDIAQGHDYVDFVALPENDLIYINTKEKPPEKLIALYPREGTFWHEHPLGIVNAEWTTDPQRDAAREFIRYVLTPEVQRLIMSRGFRPANPTVALEAPIIPDNGIDIKGPATTFSVPPPEAVAAIQDSWSLVKKRADIMLVVDISGSMLDDHKLDQAKQAMGAFLNSVADGNRVGLITFSNSVTVNVKLSSLESHKGELLAAINQLQAVGGTELYAAIQDATNLMNQNIQDNRIRVILLLSDGQDTGVQGKTLNNALQAINASKNDVNPLLVIPVAYGSDADFNALNSIARASKTTLQFGEPKDILNVLRVIASYG